MTTGRINQVDTLPSPKLGQLPADAATHRQLRTQQNVLSTQPRTSSNAEHTRLADCIENRACITTHSNTAQTSAGAQVLLKRRCLQCTHNVPAPQPPLAAKNQHQQQTRKLPHSGGLRCMSSITPESNRDAERPGYQQSNAQNHHRINSQARGLHRKPRGEHAQLYALRRLRRKAEPSLRHSELSWR